MAGESGEELRKRNGRKREVEKQFKFRSFIKRNFSLSLPSSYMPLFYRVCPSRKMNTRKGKTRGGGIKRLAGWLLLRLSLGGCTDSTGSVDIAGRREGVRAFSENGANFRRNKAFSPLRMKQNETRSISAIIISSRALSNRMNNNNNNNNNKNARLHIAKREFFLEEKRRDGLYLCGWIHDALVRDDDSKATFLEK